MRLRERPWTRRSMKDIEAASRKSRGKTDEGAEFLVSVALPLQERDLALLAEECRRFEALRWRVRSRTGTHERLGSSVSEGSVHDRTEIASAAKSDRPRDSAQNRALMGHVMYIGAARSRWLDMSSGVSAEIDGTLCDRHGGADEKGVAVRSPSSPAPPLMRISNRSSSAFGIGRLCR